MTKAQFNTLINTIDDGGLNTALEVRTLLQGVRDELYSPIYFENYPNVGANQNALSITQPTDPANQDLNYGLKMSKVGNKVFIHGNIGNYSNSTFLSGNLITITNTEFTSRYTPFYPALTINPNCGILFVANTIQINGFLAPNEEVVFNCFYYTND